MMPEMICRSSLHSGPGWSTGMNGSITDRGRLPLLSRPVVLDAFRRLIVGWAMTNHLRSELVLDALEMAITQCRPCDMIHLSDSQKIGASFRAV